MKITQLLRSDHDTIKALFKEIQQAPQNWRKQELLKEITQELEMHSVVEEEIFYPALRRSRSPEAKDIVGEAMADHHMVKNLLKVMSFLHPEELEFKTRLRELIDLVLAHIEEEEGELFREAKKNLSVEQLEDLAVEMQERKLFLIGTYNLHAWSSGLGFFN